MTTSAQQFEQGLGKIRNEIHGAIQRTGIQIVSISNSTQGSGPRDATFAITANGQTEQQSFSREEIEDSANSIDPFAATKIRMLVSRFAR